MLNRGVPVISFGIGKLRRVRMVGATSAKIPVMVELVVIRSWVGWGSLRLGPTAMKGTGLLVWSLVAEPVVGAIFDSALP